MPQTDERLERLTGEMWRKERGSKGALYLKCKSIKDKTVLQRVSNPGMSDRTGNLRKTGKLLHQMNI